MPQAGSCISIKFVSLKRCNPCGYAVFSLLCSMRCSWKASSISSGVSSCRISHSDGHSVVNRQTKKPIHRDIKNQWELCSRFKMMKLCIGSVNSETIYLLMNHSASRFTFMSGAASLVPQALPFRVSFLI